LITRTNVYTLRACTWLYRSSTQSST